MEGHSKKTRKHKATAPRPGDKAGRRLKQTEFHGMIISVSVFIKLSPAIMWKPENVPNELMMI